MTRLQSVVTNAEIADKLFSLAHLLASRKENPFKVKAYRRAARSIRALGEPIAEWVRKDADLTVFPGIGPAIASAVREIVETGTMRQIRELESGVSPEFAAVVDHPQLDPKRVLRIFKRFEISTIAELRQKLENGEIAAAFGPRMEQHVRRGLAEHEQMLLHEADGAMSIVRDYLVNRCGVIRAEPVGQYRRRVDVISEMHFLIETPRFSEVLEHLKSYGGRADLIEADQSFGLFKLSSGFLLRVTTSPKGKWGIALLAATGSLQHLDKLEAAGHRLRQVMGSSKDYLTEAQVYGELGLPLIPPELREGWDELELAANGRVPALVTTGDIKGELHSHSTSSDGVDSVEDMAEAARARGLEYIGISDHSQSLKIARGLSIERLRNQLRFIERLNARHDGIQVLKSAEVDILEDGSLDYPDDLLKELDYTICSIHSRFGMGKQAQTERILRAMDNPHFTILGHATGRLLLKRPGYEIDIDRIIEHAKQAHCFFELNSSPDRLDLSSDHARLARQAGVSIAITTDAHSARELGFIEYGVDQARRAGLEKRLTLNAMPWDELQRVLRR